MKTTRLLVLICFLMALLPCRVSGGSLLLLPLEKSGFAELRKFSDAIVTGQHTVVEAEIEAWIGELQKLPKTLVLEEDTSSRESMLVDLDFAAWGFDSSWKIFPLQLVIRLQDLAGKKNWDKDDISFLLWCKASHLNTLYAKSWYLFPTCELDYESSNYLFPTNDTNYSIFLDSFHFRKPGPEYAADSFLFSSLSFEYKLDFIRFFNIFDSKFIQKSRYLLNFETPAGNSNAALRIRTLQELMKSAEKGESVLLYFSYSRGT